MKFEKCIDISIDLESFSSFTEDSGSFYIWLNNPLYLSTEEFH
jgi:hypothetical protein